MALPDAPSAAEMAEYLRHHDPHQDHLVFRDSVNGAMAGWTTRDRRDVVEAAAANKGVPGIMYVFIDLESLTSRTAGVIGSILGQLVGVLHVEVYDSGAYEDPAPRAVVDKVLAGVATCPSKDLYKFRLSVPSGPRAFLALVERFPNLEELEYEDLFYDDAASAADRFPFLLAVAAAVSRHLQLLRRVSLKFERDHPGIPGLLSALHAAPSTLQTVELGFLTANQDWDNVLLQLAFFCACARTTNKVTFRGEDSHDLVDVSPLFGVDPAPAPSLPTITDMQFQFCSWEGKQRRRGGRLAARAVKALQTVEALSFVACAIPSALHLVTKLPRLKRLTYLTRQYTCDDEPLDPDQAQDAHNDRFALLKTNHDVAAFGRVVARKGSLLEDVELDLHGSETESFPALSRLLHVSRGRLVLHLGCLPRAACPHLVSGMEKLSVDLRELQLRFHSCRLTDEDYAAILRPLQSNMSVRRLECQWEHGGEDAAARTWAAVHDLVEANNSIETLTFCSLGPEAAAAMLESVLPALRYTNRSIRTLELDDTDLKGVWPRLRGPMLEMLQENYALSHLPGFGFDENLSYLLRRELCHDPVHLLVKQNRYGRRFLMGGGDGDSDSASGGGSSSSLTCPLGLWAKVLARISDDEEASVMYKFLRSMPDVLAGPAHGRPRRPDSPLRRTEGRKRGWSGGLAHGGSPTAGRVQCSHCMQ